MKSWKKLIQYLHKDSLIAKKLLLPFLIIFYAWSILYYTISYFINSEIYKHSIFLFPLFIAVISYSIGLLLLQIIVQQKYSKLLNTSAILQKTETAFLNVVKIYVTQVALWILILIIFCICIYIPTNIIKINNLFISFIISLLTLLFIIFSIFWFYRLLFIKYIVVYKHSNSIKLIHLIKESKLLLFENIGIVISFFIIYILCLIPQIGTIMRTHSAQTTNYFSTLLLTLFTGINTYLFIVLTTNTITDIKPLGKLEQKNEEQLTTAST